MSEETGAICGDGMCPYIPCKEYPLCKHINELVKKMKKIERLKEVKNK